LDQSSPFHAAPAQAPSFQARLVQVQPFHSAPLHAQPFQVVPPDGA